ncbi:hypothetical protein S1OALGB6SA_1804 [Olavius algarvensis spirochete endosymbiont]|nr:hypothetical protein S1OALGB6SA_1804 [Olavius algarvensis spirochete endosymbiont]
MTTLGATILVPPRAFPTRYYGSPLNSAPAADMMNVGKKT